MNRFRDSVGERSGRHYIDLVDADERFLVIKNTSERAGLLGKIPSPRSFSQENTDLTGALVR
jgi:hypothetical protein